MRFESRHCVTVQEADDRDTVARFATRELEPDCVAGQAERPACLRSQPRGRRLTRT